MLQLKSGKYLGSVKRNWDACGVLISETEYPERVFEGWHYHQNHHISFIMQGGNKEQRKGLEVEIRPGEIVSYKSGELHRNFNTHPLSRNINLEIEDNFFSEYDLKADCFSIDPSAYADAKFTILKIYKECLSGDDHSNTSVHSLLLGLIGCCKKYPKDTPGWAIQLRNVLHDRWNENISLHELARLVQVHPVTISKFFPRYFNCTMGEYNRKLRIEKAISFICTTRLSLTGIAYQCGFFDQSHFIRVFKDVTGFLPNQYKKIGG